MVRTAGVDWASAAHEVCVVDEGEVIWREEVPPDERGIAFLCRRLIGLRVLAELARTDAHRFRPLVPDSDEIKALRALTRARADAVGVRVELANQLSAQLEAFWPGAMRLFGDVDSKISLAFLGRYPTEVSLAADTGVSPVALESGKRRGAVFRRACDKRLRGAAATLANSTRQWQPWAEDVYRRARETGADHPHALRILGRAWVRVLWRCWVERVPYNPALHGGLLRRQPGGG